jgi:hypothetical protein
VDCEPSNERNHTLGLSSAHPLPQNGLNSADAQEISGARAISYSVAGWRAHATILPSDLLEMCELDDAEMDAVLAYCCRVYVSDGALRA